ncbi:hypothetical protein [Cellulomonas sp. PhB143]|uniref:hypothetical protein n=1 Tax=Cellulomonas sp. PhB143 TaxID=2485186 RepID=UPI000F460FE5|nr:hypothetical protein [Cellulomonas sp. PhB143]ROS76596.1 hypothetical protein EDF32_1416 [Cellulomonas sp. PhB143]
MASWEGALDALVEARGEALVTFATDACGDAAAAPGIVADALVDAFSRLRPPPPAPPPAEEVVVGPVYGARTTGASRRPAAETGRYDLDLLEAQVRRAVLDRAGRPVAGAGGRGEGQHGGPDDVLHLTLGALVPEVRRRVRRRRATRRGRLGATSLVAVAVVALVLVAPSLAGSGTGAVPAGGATSSSASSLSATLAPREATDAARGGLEAVPEPEPLPAGFVDGHVPAGLDGQLPAGVVCGAPAVALAPTTLEDDGVALDLTGAIDGPGAGGTNVAADARVILEGTLASSLGGPLLAPRDAAVAWVSSGRVVGLGAPGESRPIDDPGEDGVELAAATTLTDLCVPGSSKAHPTPMPAGAYSLVAFLPVAPADDPSTVTWVRSAASPVTLSPDGDLTIREVAEPGPGPVPGEVLRATVVDDGIQPDVRVTSVGQVVPGTRYALATWCSSTDATGELPVEVEAFPAGVDGGTPLSASATRCDGTVSIADVGTLDPRTNLGGSFVDGAVGSTRGVAVLAPLDQMSAVMDAAAGR